MNPIQKIYRIILGACTSLLLLGGCTNLFDENYSQIVTDQFVPKEQDLYSLIGPAYASWRTLVASREAFRGSQEHTADALVIPARPNGWVDGGIYKRLHEHKWTAQDPNPTVSWNTAYTGITNTNRVIYQIDSGQIPVLEGKDNILAELRVLRASYYYVLCDLFGNVPIVTQYDVPAGFLPEQSTRRQVYDFIINEITQSLPLLSETVDQSTYGRFNSKWAANALLAKMYLNAQVYVGQPEWEKCIAACDAIINSNKYLLENSVRDVFRTANESSKEIVFAVPFDEIYATGFNIHRETLQPANQRTYNMEGSPFGGIGGIPQFIDTYDPDDARLMESWIQGQQYSSTGQPLNGSLRATSGKPLIYINFIPSVDSTEEIHGFRQGKYEYKIGVRNNLSNDVPLFRYADVLMMKAEALLRSNDAAAAATIVTEVRQRSFRTNPAKAVVTAADLMRGSVYEYGPARNNVISPIEGGADIPYGRFLDELGWEFAQEFRRRQDLIRFGVFTRKSWLSHTPNGDYLTLFPIPQAGLNTNPKLKQNPGYL